MLEAHQQTDHHAVRPRAEARGARPACVMTMADRTAGAVLGFDCGGADATSRDVLSGKVLRLVDDKTRSLLGQDQTGGAELRRIAKLEKR